MRSNRRRFVKTIGTTGIGLGALSSTGAAQGLLDGLLDDFDLTADRHEALIVFDGDEAVDRLDLLDLVDGYRKYRTLPIGYAPLTTAQLREVLDWPSVVSVTPNHELEYYNDDGRELTGAARVQRDLGYTGENVEVAVIDTGVNGSHPDLRDNLASNYQVLPNPLSDSGIVVDAGSADTDDVGHGTHAIGSIAGTGDESDGEYAGMAPDATVHSYAVNATLSVVTALEALDHVVAERRAGNTNVAVVSNSWGASSGDDYDPSHPINVATWAAHEEGILPVFSAGNEGPDPNTLNDYAKGPHVLGVAATDSEQQVADFSSRGRTPEHENANYDRREAYANATAVHDGTPEDDIDGPVGLYRIGVGAKGEDVMSTLSPYDPLQVAEPDEELAWYGLMSGTSMSCPITSGCATLVIDAYLETEGELPAPMDVLHTLEAEADIVADAEPAYAPYNMGAGFVNAHDAVSRVENGEFAAFDDSSADGVERTGRSTGARSTGD